jgi:hypothetical protein
MRLRLFPPSIYLFAVFVTTLASAQSSRVPLANRPATPQNTQEAYAGSHAPAQSLATPRIPAFKSPIMRKLWEDSGKNNQGSHPVSQPAGGSLFLTTPPTYAVGSQPLGIATGDFNNDGKQDVVVAANPPQLLLGNGDGTLQSAIAIGTIGATDVVVADFNHDGNLDVAFAISGAAVVYLGNGNGTFGAPATYSSGSANEIPRILTADVNNDGIPDLILSTATGVSVLLGNGNGTFQAAKNSSAPDGVWSMAIADFNKDGRLDLAVTDGFSTLSILLGNGNGTFSLASSYPTTSSGTLNSVATADFNRDGNPDVALPNGQVFLGNGDGTLKTPGTFETSPRATFVVSLDMNGDGIPDLATTSSSPECGTVDFGITGVALGNGDGTFQPITLFDSGGCTNPVFMAIGDLNDDGFLDIVISSGPPGFAEPQQVSVLLNNGSGRFPAAELDISGGSGGVTAGDFNRDGNLDLASADGSVYLGNGAGTLKFLASAFLGGVQVANGDFSNNGNLDLAAAVECVSAGCSGGGGLAISVGNGDGTFQPVTMLPSGGFFAESLVIADFNNDGNLDIAILNNCVDINCSNPGGSVTIFLGNGGGTFGSGNTIALNQASFGGNPLALVAGDFNNDGNIDLVAVGSGSGGVLGAGVANVLLGNGNGTFQSPIVFQTPGDIGISAATVADFNQDGILDLGLDDGYTCADCGGHGNIMYGNGDGTFTSGPTIDTSGAPSASIVAADFYGTGSLTAVLNNECVDVLDCPSGSVMNVTAPDIMLFYLAVGDFNNDGKPDLVGSLQYDAGASVLLNVGATAAATTTTLSPASLQSYSAFQPATFTAKVQHTGTLIATGQVSFLDNGVSIESAPLGSNGLATFTTTQLGVGSHFIVANYGGDSNFASSNSLGAHVTITQSSTTITLSASANPSGYEQAVKFTATITPAFGSGATGTVTFYEGTTQIGHSAVTKDRATFSTYLLQVGTRSITAIYSGDANFLGSSSSKLSQVVNPATTATSLNSSQNPSHSGQTVTFTTKITGQYGGIPVGNVTFKDGATTLATVALSQGLAKYSTSSLAKGNHQISASYGGNSDFLPSSSATLTQVVK